MNLGILGGTFDPVHHGHVALAEAAIECAAFDRLVVIPARLSPHKERAMAPAPDRLEMARLAFAGLDRVEVSDVEVRRDGPSFTADTLAAIEQAHPDADLTLVLGWDAARLLRTWHEPDRVLELASLLLFRRPGLNGPTPDDVVAAGISYRRAAICEIDTPAIEATDIRRRVAAGEPLLGLVPEAVAKYIADRGLYRDNSAH